MRVSMHGIHVVMIQKYVMAIVKSFMATTCTHLFGQVWLGSLKLVSATELFSILSLSKQSHNQHVLVTHRVRHRAAATTVRAMTTYTSMRAMTTITRSIRRPWRLIQVHKAMLRGTSASCLVEIRRVAVATRAFSWDDSGLCMMWREGV